MSQTQFKPKIEPVTEDTVNCLFFFTSLLDSDRNWQQRCSDINSTIEKISENYIWHRDKFRLYQPIRNTVNGIPLHLASSTCFGDNVEDEWFIVYIILELTKQYDDLIVQARDNDGEFLLIEAANLLPFWANPENTDNRVFIANNHIHIIEPGIQISEEKVDLPNAIKMVSNKQTYVSSDIDQAILTRIGNYPKKIENNLHKTVVNLPVSIATMLSLKPALIAPIVIAYCNHDIIDLKACKNMSLENCVTVELTFTKFLYAMLMHSKLVKCNSKYKFMSEKNKRDVIGMKLTCGFQMIMNSYSDIFSTKEYHKFESSLKENGYFKDNIEGSKEYTALLEKAKCFFSTVECPMNLHVSNQISQLMLSEEYASEMKKIQMNNLSTSELCEDSEDWLSIQPDQLNIFLDDKYGNKNKLKKDDVITPDVMTSELAKFLIKSSDYEGIETNNEHDNNGIQIDFDADEFSNCLKNIMNLLTTTEVNDVSADSNDIDEDLLEFETDYDNEMNEELKTKLNSNHKDDLYTNYSISQNIMQSLKEEQALSGPSSNLLKAVGINKSYVLDSDDDGN